MIFISKAIKGGKCIYLEAIERDTDEVLIENNCRSNYAGTPQNLIAEWNRRGSLPNLSNIIWSYILIKL